jgi:hypothetical protein
MTHSRFHQQIVLYVNLVLLLVIEQLLATCCFEINVVPLQLLTCHKL